MILKTFFALALTVSAFVSIAQDVDTRSELPETCLTYPTTLTDEAPEAFLFSIDFECQIFNYKFTIVNSEGEIVFESTDPTEKWNAIDMVAGFYSWEILGTIGNTIEYEHVKKNGAVEVIK